MIRTIDGFHRDDVGDGVAELSCLPTSPCGTGRRSRTGSGSSTRPAGPPTSTRRSTVRSATVPHAVTPDEAVVLAVALLVRPGTPDEA